MNNKDITDRLKRIRHEYSILKSYIPNDYLISRDSIKDIGKTSNFEKMTRNNIIDIVRASFGRTEESMRVIEEYGKLISVQLSQKAKRIRFELYTLEKDTINEFEKNKMIFPKQFGLYLVMTDPIIGYEKLTEIAVKNNIRVIQLRDKKLNDKKLLNIAKRIKNITKYTQTLFFVNDRIDIAMLSNADGLHIGQTDISIKQVKSFSQTILIGKSTHNEKQLKSALKENPDYIGIGPIYKTFSKKIPDVALGINGAKHMLKMADRPAIGIGGIKDINLRDVLNIGFVNFGIISYITNSKNPDKEIKKIKKIYRSYYDTKNKSH